MAPSLASTWTYSVPAGARSQVPADIYPLASVLTDAAVLKQSQVHMVQNPSLQQAAYAQTLTPQVQSQVSLDPTTYAQMQTATQAVTYAQPYVASQQGHSVQLSMPQFQQPSYVPAPSLAVGLPDPQTIAQQKLAYAQALDADEGRALEALEKQRQQHMHSIHEQAEQQRKQILLQMEHEKQHMEMMLGRDFAQQVSQTKQKYNELRSSLEQQAIKLAADFQQKEVQAVAMKLQAQLRQEKAVSELSFMAKMQKLQPHVSDLAFMTEDSQRLQQPAHIFQTPSYVPPVVAAHNGSYVPPPISMAMALPQQTGSYVPPPAMSMAQLQQTGSYVPPPAMQTGSYVPPPGMNVVVHNGSYVAPPIAMTSTTYVLNGSYVPPPSGLAQSQPAPSLAQPGSYVPPPALQSSVQQGYYVLPQGSTAQPQHAVTHAGGNQQQIHAGLTQCSVW